MWPGSFMVALKVRKNGEQEVDILLRRMNSSSQLWESNKHQYTTKFHQVNIVFHNLMRTNCPYFPGHVHFSHAVRHIYSRVGIRSAQNVWVFIVYRGAHLNLAWCDARNATACHSFDALPEHLPIPEFQQTAAWVPLRCAAPHCTPPLSRFAAFYKKSRRKCSFTDDPQEKYHLLVKKWVAEGTLHMVGMFLYVTKVGKIP